MACYRAIFFLLVSVFLSACGGGGGGSSANVSSGNTAPAISSIANQLIDEDVATGPLPFTVSDAQTAAGLLQVTATSSNQALVPDISLVLAGTGTNRTIEVTPVADQSGTATITVVVSDGADTATTTFSVTVNAANDPPTAVTDVFTVAQGSVDAPLDVLGNDLDADLPADTLTITAVGTPSAGGTVTNAGSQLLYTATPGYTGTETFSYTIEDAALVSATATVTVSNVGIGLAHYWKLDEASAPYDDSVGSAPASCVTCPTGTAGLIGSAQVFDGLDDAVSVDSVGSLNWDSNQSFSIEFWINKNTSCVGEEAVIGRVDTQTQLKWWVGCGAAGKAVFELFDENGAGQTLTASTGLDDGNWHHVAAIRDAGAGQNRLYVDGVLDASVSIVYPDGFTSQTAELSIGWLDDSAVDYDFSGIVDEVAIHTGVLSNADISQHYMDGSIGLRRGYLACTGSVRIMPLGDSNTDSINGLKSYRPRLYFDLVNAGYNVDFVGSRQDPSGLHDRDHEGWSGFTPANIAVNLNDWLSQNPNDVILLHIGTNQLSVIDVEDILNIVDAYNPNITVVLARIINRATYHQPTTDFNIALEIMAQNRISNGDKIVVVDMEPALLYPDDMVDIVHATETGYNKMAVVWANNLTTFLPVCP